MFKEMGTKSISNYHSENGLCEFMFKTYWFIIMFCECIHAVSPPVFRPVSIDTCNLDLLVETDQVECGVNNFTSIPAAASVDFIHLATVSFDTGLYGFNDVVNNEVMLPLSSFMF